MKRILVAALSLLISAGTFAQSFGIVGGFTSSQSKVKDIDVKAAAGFNAGIAYNIPLGLGFALQPELIYNVKGSNLEDLKANYKLGYVEVPVQIQWGFDVDVFRPYVFAEPFIGYAVTGSQVFDKVTKEFDMDSLGTRMEYGLGFGAGLMLAERIQLSLKYFWNLDSSNDLKNSFEALKLDKNTDSFDGIVISAGLFF